jgi:hypothetical protein
MPSDRIEPAMPALFEIGTAGFVALLNVECENSLQTNRFVGLTNSLPTAESSLARRARMNLVTL